jgi:hypothetical protein
VKLIKRSEDKILFHLARREGELLRRLLKRYPRVPPAHQRLSKSGVLPNSEEDQRLLDEALAEQRAECRKQLQALAADPQRFRSVETGFRLSLAPHDAEWLLQVLNDIRVGSWVNLGSPEANAEEMTALNADDLWTMELAGHFEMELLRGLEAGRGD